MKNAVNETNTPETPALVKTIGKTTYIVNVHFSETARETVADKLKRLISTDSELREG
ncbi:MAG: transposon-encoded TnpW family protein [Ruminiclostridium sp.]|nr:transposon-encoded TnpW family protein [Ruminiclostridium sp.]